MKEPVDGRPNDDPTILSNAEVADRLASLAQLLSTQKENPYKVKAYHRAAAHIRNLPDSLDEMVRQIENAGGKLQSRGEHAPGVPYAYFTDPDGYVIELGNS